MADSWELTWMRIAKEVTHCTVQETKARMSVPEFRRWQAYFLLEQEELSKRGK